MNKRFIQNISRLLCVTMSACAVSTPLIACNDNTELPSLVLATDVLDGVFNPFFYTSGSDGEIVSQTQIGMLSSDASGKLVSGWDEPCVAFDHSVVKTGTKSDKTGINDYSKFYTDYYLAIKDNIKFSDGVSLTKDDVLFNIYMYLDPAYTGSSTMYSVNIKGLKEYRTQTLDTTTGDADSEYASAADGRMSVIEDWCEEDAVWGDFEDFEYYRDDDGTVTDAVLANDINKVQSYYMQSLNESWTSAESADKEKEYAKYKDVNNNVIIKETWQLFLLKYGTYKLNPKYGNDGKIAYYEPQDLYARDDHSKETLIQYIYDSKFAEQRDATKSYKDNLKSVMNSYPVFSYMYDYLLSDVKYRKFKGEKVVKKVSGIEILKLDSIPFLNNEGTKEFRDLQSADGVKRAYDVLHITINGLDPKAIQNFGFTVAPGHYYSDSELWQKAVNQTDDSSEFGVAFSDPSFMDRVRQKQLPLGAGPYIPAKSSGGYAAVKSDFFNSTNLVCFESNPYFLLGRPKIERLRYKVIGSSMLYNSVKRGEVHYASPSMKQDQTTELIGSDSNVLSFAQADNLGYGYIGVSARYIPNIYIRRAIMTTLDPNMCVTYYGQEGASVITRPISKTLTDYYPNEPPRYEFDDTGDAAKALLEQAGCTYNNDALYDNKGNLLKYTFTIAGDSDDHPAYQMLVKSAGILNKLGLEVTVVNDSMALSKLASGLLTVWAAAWGSSSDPDMYQVYHKDSSATSTTAWGYKYIFSKDFDKFMDANNLDQRTMITDLSYKISEGREYDDVTTRKGIYKEALNMLMDLAVEFPTYQRKVYYVWKKGVLKEDTMFTGTEVTTYQSPLSRIWEVELA